MATETQHVEVIQQMTESFLGKVTTEQLERISTGVPDVSTKILLTELPLELLSSLTDLFVIAVKHKDIDEHCDFSGLKETLAQSFSEALGVEEAADNVSISRFSEMIQKELTENVRSIRSTGENNNIIPPGRLNALSSCALEILRTFPNRLAFAVTRQKENQTPRSSEGAAFPSKTAGSESSPAEITATEIICGLIDETPDLPFRNVMVETSRELLCADEQVTRFIFNTQKSKSSFKKVSRNFKEYFTVCFARAWTSRFLDKLSWRQQKEGGEDEDLPQLVSQFVHSHLHEDAKAAAEAAGGERSLNACEDPSGRRLVTFMRELSQFVHNAVKQRTGSSEPALSEGEMYEDIRARVWIFTVLMNWWVHDQMSKVSERMNLAQADEEMKECEGPLSQHGKVRFVFILVEKVVLNLYYTLKMMPANIDKVIKHVFENVLDEVQGADLYFCCGSFKIYKAVNAELLRRFGSPEAVLFLLNSKDPVVQECFIAVLKRTMMKPPKSQRPLQRFFSSFFCMKNRKCGCS